MMQMNSDAGCVRRLLPSPLGTISLAANAGGLTRVSFLEDDLLGYCELNGRTQTAGCQANDFLTEACAWLDAFLAGDQRSLSCPINLEGTPFQQLVWEVVRQIPFGQVRTYGQIADEIAQIRGKRPAPRAVGQAVAKNPILLFVPCHRVVLQNGRIGGYAGGIARKQWLLSLEKG